MNKPKSSAPASAKPLPLDPQVGGRFERLPDGSLRSLDTPPEGAHEPEQPQLTPPVSPAESE